MGRIGKLGFSVMGCLVLLLPAAGAWGDIHLPGTSCWLSVDQVGPSEIRAGRSGIFLLKLENRYCDSLKLQLNYRLSRNSRSRRTYPIPDRVVNPGAPGGSVLIWKDVNLKSGRTALFEVGTKVLGPRDETRTTQVCVRSVGSDEFACEDFRYTVLP